MNNLTWAKLIIRQLVNQGVSHFCLAPGSRSTPLAIALKEEENAIAAIHFDERGLGFYALGLAKGSRKTVGIIVTSGTAVGNLMPAVMEAWHDHIPLFLLTADRPPELRECGANQTTNQVKIFSSFVHWEVDLPCPILGGERYLASTINYGAHLASSKKGPVHCNCMFREPLLGNASPLGFDTDEMPIFETRSVCYYQDLPQLSSTTLEKIAAELSQHEKGIIICGQNNNSPISSSILALAEHMQWPLLADVGSNLRGKPSPAAISYYDFILKNDSDLQPTAILHCGGRLISRTLLEWFHQTGAELYLHIDDQTNRLDPQQIVTHYLCKDSESVCGALIDCIPQNFSSSWLNQWQQCASNLDKTIQTLLPSTHTCNEPGLMHVLQKHLTTEQSLFLANSMPIRDANLFLFPSKEIGSIFTNRGLSGIDGNMATIAGIADATQKPLIAVLGDLTALHDLNSLALIKKTNTPILLIIINNAGGAIFSFLPHLATTPHFEELFAHHHPWEFERAAALFSLPYQTPASMSDLDAVIKEFCTRPSTCLFELHTERAANFQLHQEIDAKIKKNLASIPNTIHGK